MNTVEFITDIESLRVLIETNARSYDLEVRVIEQWNRISEKYFECAEPEQVSESESETHFDYEELIRLVVWCLGCSRPTAKKHLKDYLNG